MRGLGGDALEDVVDERVEDEHGLVGDAGVGVDLLEDLVDVGRAADAFGGRARCERREEGRALGLLALLGALLLLAVLADGGL